MDYELPQYSPSVPAPDYTFEPACGEWVLEYTPRSTQPAPESTFIKQAGKITVVLHNQEENATTPSYGRGATVAGSVLLDSSDNICEVVLKVHLPTTFSVFKQDPDASVVSGPWQTRDYIIGGC